MAPMVSARGHGGVASSSSSAARWHAAHGPAARSSKAGRSSLRVSAEMRRDQRKGLVAGLRSGATRFLNVSLGRWPCSFHRVGRGQTPPQPASTCLSHSDCAMNGLAAPRAGQQPCAREKWLESSAGSRWRRLLASAPPPLHFLPSHTPADSLPPHCMHTLQHAHAPLHNTHSATTRWPRAWGRCSSAPTAWRCTSRAWARRSTLLPARPCWAW